MNIPPATSPVWSQLLLGQLACSLECLPIKFFLARVKSTITKDSSSQTLKQHASELRELFVANASLPSAQRDLTKLFT